jgi:hypothetical protein
MPKATLSATRRPECGPWPRSAPSWAARKCRKPFAGGRGLDVQHLGHGIARGARHHDYKRLFAAGGRLTRAERVLAGRASGGGWMRRWAGVGIVGWAAAAGVLAMVNGGVRAGRRRGQVPPGGDRPLRGRAAPPRSGARRRGRGRRCPPQAAGRARRRGQGSGRRARPRRRRGSKEDDVILSYQGERVAAPPSSAAWFARRRADAG